MIFSSLFRFKPKPAPVEAATYVAIVAAARQPVFYRDWAVPDTIDGRFDLLLLHLSLVLERIGKQDDALRQALTNRFTEDMDANLREIGASDVSVAKKVRAMAEALKGRYEAYVQAHSPSDMETAVRRNVYAGLKTPYTRNLAAYALQARASLAKASIDEIRHGQLGLDA